MMDAAAAAHVLQGRLVGRNVPLLRVTTDSRALQEGDLFVALKGERFDGHDFVQSAFDAGARAALVSRGRIDRARGSLIEVDDPLAALGRLAAHWRARFDIPVIVVVGSNGKTTVKEMTAAILRAHFGEHVLATRGNLNNAIGLPLTLLGLREQHRAAVIELGMNHRGETGELAPIAQPTIALINNAQREHQEFMQSVAEVAREHADLLTCVRAGGTAVLNCDDPHVDVWRASTPRGVSIVEFGMERAATVRAEVERHDGETRARIVTSAGEVQTTLHVAGRHNISNALAASAAALAAGASLHAVGEGLAAFRPVSGRLVTRRGEQGEALIDDTYNANPDSVRAAIAVLAEAATPRWLVLGDMGEVGAAGPAFHREAGDAARAAGIERLFTTGSLASEASAAFGHGAQHFATVDALAGALAGLDRAGTTILVKGSRFMRMERVVARLCGESGGDAH